jgi:DNA polymerase-3 subunit beta
MEAALNLNALQAVACAVSIKETRYYLRGVCVEISPRQTIYVATNGGILFAYRDVITDGGNNDLLGTWIIPGTIIKTIKIRKGRNASIEYATLTGELGKVELSLKRLDGSNLGFRAIDGTFPDWRRVVPEKTEQKGPIYLFDPDLLKKLWKAGEMLDEGQPSMDYNSDGPALLKYKTDNALGVIMPLRNSVAVVTKPAWACPPDKKTESVSSLESVDEV